MRRLEFLLGKFLGVVLLLALCVSLMSLAFAVTLYVQEMNGLQYVQDSYDRGGAQWRDNAYAVSQFNHDTALVYAQVRDPQLVQAILLIFAKLVMMSGVGLLISTFASSSIFTIVTTFMIYLIGNMESTAREVWLAAQGGHPGLLGNILVGLISLLVPDMSAFSIVDEILAGNHVPWSHTCDLLGYAAAYLVVLLALSVVVV